MVTVEHINYDTVITVLDTENKHDDLEVILDADSTVWLRQFNHEYETVDLVCISMKQFASAVKAFGLAEGTYMMETNDEL